MGKVNSQVDFEKLIGGDVDFFWEGIWSSIRESICNGIDDEVKRCKEEYLKPQIERVIKSYEKKIKKLEDRLNKIEKEG